MITYLTLRCKMPKIKILITEILQYLGNRLRPLKEGEAVYQAGHIILCGIDVEIPNMLKSLCLQTSALTSEPHEVSIKLEDNTYLSSCSCKAGLSGFCKHIIATLIYVNRNEDLEYVSCTDVKQKWGKEKKAIQEKYEARPVHEFCHPVIKPTPTASCSEEVYKRNFDLLRHGVGKSSLVTFVERAMKGEKSIKQNKRIAEDVTSIFKNINCSTFLPKMKDIKIIVDSLTSCCKILVEQLQNANTFIIATETCQGSEAWKNERQLRITGSTCYAIYTFGTIKDDWEKKSMNFFFPKGFTNKFTEHGLKYEKEAISLFAKNNNVHICEPSLIICDRFPWLAYSPDGIIFEDNFPKALLELKCPYIGKERGEESFINYCSYLEEINGKIALKKKHPYYGQVQLGMAILNLPLCHFVMYASHTKTYLNIIVYFNELFAEDLIRTVTNKYFRKMLHYYCLNKSN